MTLIKGIKFSIFFPAVVLMLIVIMASSCNMKEAMAQEIAWDNYSDEQIVNAIFYAEGGHKAQYLYGIRSIKYKDIAEARRICFNSVRNGRARWIKADKPYDLVTHIGMRYCPPKVHPLNSNWVKNVKNILRRSK